MIPCMLFTKCAATLAANRSLVLIALPLTAVLQVTSILSQSLPTASCCNLVALHCSHSLHPLDVVCIKMVFWFMKTPSAHENTMKFTSKFIIFDLYFNVFHTYWHYVFYICACLTQQSHFVHCFEVRIDLPYCRS